MNKSLTVLPSGEYPTMSSLEMVDYINADRKSKAEAEGLLNRHRFNRHLRVI